MFSKFLFFRPWESQNSNFVYFSNRAQERPRSKFKNALWLSALKIKINIILRFKKIYPQETVNFKGHIYSSEKTLDKSIL